MAFPLRAPPGLWHVASSLATAQSWASLVDASQGYPRAGVEDGVGPHVKDAGGGPFVTTQYAEIVAHPTLPQWAYPRDAVTAQALAGKSGLPAAAALDATWAGAQPVGQVVAALALSRRTTTRRNVAAVGVTAAVAIGGIGLAAALGPGPASAPMTVDAGDAASE